MSLEIIVPEVSDGVTAGTVIAITVAVNDQVEEDQTLLELETDKAVVAIPSPAAGVISAIKVAEGDSAAVGSVIMVLEPVNSVAEEPVSSVEDAAEVAPPQAEALPVEPASTSAPLEVDPLPPATDQHVADEVDLVSVRRDHLVAPAAPSVRRIARDLGVDIYQVQGTGAGGRISEDDVRLFVRETMQRVTGGQSTLAVTGEFRGLHAQRPLPDFSKWGEVSRQPLSRVRELTADAMGYAWSTIPMVTQYDKVRVSGIETFRRDFNYAANGENKLTMTAILVKVCAAALTAFPQFNSSLDLASKELVLKKYIHVGVAVDTPGGLLVPVIRDANQKGIESLALELNQLAVKTRERKISPADLEGGTFTISNLGGIGGTSFTPIVYAPQVAILGVSRAETEPQWNGQEFVPEKVMTLSLTYDHRVIDGADGARFLRWICEAIENPLNLVMKG
ncbi:pyruvate dehydrogenase E2 component (dihydrolipoamide acetyltransferase) [Desulfuromusa kysingii]|uniref:Dihydrolipoamide acetyltransferase component of pyruvate dehydrogenase complex n=1 Tax=Desulfuromusa kysingii TaxID=37625 RepID=A0A1H3W0X3_9BACT|nr:2-oxo acid dehydrogenase subunit E2 [Desulfuromusa kysingii]SDZ80706.1 pyruvate dehydrogenase E2 component (dihydrolipoamide acetyltransferase) [Desulfuromusa kysingii]